MWSDKATAECSTATRTMTTASVTAEDDREREKEKRAQQLFSERFFVPFRAPELMLLPLALFSRNEKTRENSTTADVKQAQGRNERRCSLCAILFPFLTHSLSRARYFLSLNLYVSWKKKLIRWTTAIVRNANCRRQHSSNLQ